MSICLYIWTYGQKSTPPFLGMLPRFTMKRGFRSDFFEDVSCETYVCPTRTDLSAMKPDVFLMVTLQS